LALAIEKAKVYRLIKNYVASGAKTNKIVHPMYPGNSISIPISISISMKAHHNKRHSLLALTWPKGPGFL
jgi:hypothetical protein